MKSAIIGYGVIGAVHLSVLKSQGGTEIAVCDVDETKLSALSGVEKYTDYKKMLDEFRPDVVHVCTPHYLHAEMVVECLKRNINVLCEKPLCIQKEELLEILKAEQSSLAQLGVCHQNRYNAANVFTKDYLEKEKPLSGFGTVVWRRTAEYYASGAWRGKWSSEGGGVLINQALHTLDLLIWFLGEPNEVEGTISNLSLPEIEVEDTASIVCKNTDTGAGFSFFATNASAVDFPVEVTVKTNKETIKVMPECVTVGGQRKVFQSDDKFYGKYCYGSGHGRLIADFYDCVKTGRKFPIDAKEGGKVVNVILTVYKQAKRRKGV